MTHPNPFTASPALPAKREVNEDGVRIFRCGVRSCPERLASLPLGVPWSQLLFAEGYMRRPSGYWTYSKRAPDRLAQGSETGSLMRVFHMGEEKVKQKVRRGLKDTVTREAEGYVDPIHQARCARLLDTYSYKNVPDFVLVQCKRPKCRRFSKIEKEEI